MDISQKNVATRSLLIKLIQSGWTFRDLARKADVDIAYLRNQAALNFPCRRIRLVIEQTLGIPFFSTEEEFNRRAALAVLFGFDPSLALVSRLHEFAREHGLYAPTNFRKPRLIESLAAQLSAKSQSKNKSHAKRNQKRRG